MTPDPESLESYEVELIDREISFDTIGVVAEIKGKTIKHTFPKKSRWLREEDGSPMWVWKLRKIYYDRYVKEEVDDIESYDKVGFGTY